MAGISVAMVVSYADAGRFNKKKIGLTKEK
jgi:hypothetical protein